MPLISVWPVSSFSDARNVGSCLRSIVERVAELLAVVGAFRLDRHRDDRLGKFDRLQQNRLAGVAERVAGDRLAQPDHADDVAGPGLVDLLFFLRRVNPPQLRDVFLLVLARVQHARVRLERARVDPHPRQVARLVRQHLEHQPAERLLRIGLPLNFLRRARRPRPPCPCDASSRDRCLRPAACRAGSASTRPPHPESAALPSRAAPTRRAPAESANEPSPSARLCE